MDTNSTSDYGYGSSDDYLASIFELFKEKVYPRPYEYLIIVIYGLVFLLAIIGNTLVCIAVLRNEHMRTVTNYYIVNLAVADILVSLVCLPITVVVDISESWFFGDVMCSVIPYIQNTSVCVSIFTLTMIAVDRYLAICRPLKFQISSKRTVITVIVIWVLSLFTMLPNSLSMVTRSEPIMETFGKPLWLTKCSDFKWEDSPWRAVYAVVTLLFTYLLPLCVVGVAYCMVCLRLWSGIPSDETSHKSSNNNAQGNGKSKRAPRSMNKSTEAQLQSRRKVARMLIVVVVLFAVCYLPIRVLNVLQAFGVFGLDNIDMMRHGEKVTVAYLIAHIMAFFNSAINPVIYNFMSEKFRRQFRRLLCCQGEPLRQHYVTEYKSRSATNRTRCRVV
ncbi:orexin receptor type 2-like isoform X2 [Patiria miniata]|uniref:G-protein coupled receptors family 1 profile domain-containing protein n=1 Tax=Patiria miniata TaxID=46514 RepID=A0A913ZZY7_PATMI|nr:orexin receptor type 2-like isoform X2 [Patiria miniata]